MSVKVVVATDLPSDATRGFRVMDGAKVVAFFHWHDDPVESMPYTYTTYTRAEEADDWTVKDHTGTGKVRRTSYADVLAVLPDRLAAAGLETESAHILADVIKKFGSGQ